MSSTIESTSAVQALKNRMYELNALEASMSIFGWDQQCFMPSGAAEARANHMAILHGLHHEMFTSDETGNLLAKAASEVSSDSEDAAMVRVVQRDFDLSTKLPAELVTEKTKLGAIAHEQWVTARSNNDFASFAPTLEKMFDIARQEAECLGYEDHIYDALFDLYEEGAKKEDAEKMFDTIREPLVALVKEIKERGKEADDSFLTGDWDDDKQREFTEKIAEAVGFDFERGRQDTAHHPFCGGWSVNDVRLTTRFMPMLGSAIFSTLHEAGHGMYEQGSPTEWDRTPLAGGVSLGVHESQSRLWENIVGRSKPFWQRFLPDLQAAFPALNSVDLDRFHRGVNKVEPSLIRVEADELTYNLHILIRFEIECGMLEGSMQIKDLPEIWNSKYEQYLGITPDSDANGCLQDVHWSGGAIGYFPTYSMGNLLSYQIWKALIDDLGSQDENMAAGNFEPILTWLQEKIYRHGRRYQPADLIERATGKAPGAEDYLEGITAKYRSVYEI